MLNNKKGFTLVEIIIALLVLLLVFLALMQTALLGIDSNMKNVLRDEAVRIAEQRMSEAKNLPFTNTVDNLVSDTAALAGADCPAGFGGTGILIERNVRSIANFDFCTVRTVRQLETNSKEVTITTGWRWKGEDYRHSVMTVVRRQ